ncbi:hypothetical protein LTR08_006375 [Meristemomyces frigidus]|nr:hypothetical protein LTR08_006375 [Meristemomyces frigidus]
MAALFSRSLTSRTLLASTGIVSAAGITYYATRRPLLLDSAQNAPLSTTMNFPWTMLFAKQLTVTHVEQVNHDTKRITFALPGGSSEVSGVSASSALLTQHKPPDRYLPVLRPYTPVSSPSSPGTLQLLVKKYPHGAASTHMHDLTPGSTLTVRGPIPGYAWQASPSQPRDVLFIAGGAGITPIYSLAAAVLSNAHDQTRITLLWGVNGTRDLVLQSEFAQLQRQYPGRLRVSYFISGSAEAQSLVTEGPESRQSGYVDKSALRTAIEHCEAGSFGDEKGTKVFFCGPPGMQEGVVGKKGVLSELGVGKREVHVF